MTSFAKQHARLTGLFEGQRRPFMDAAKIPQYAGWIFIKQATVPLCDRIVLTATCSATLIDRMYTAVDPTFDDHVEGRADIVFDYDLRLYPVTSVRLLRGWNVEQAEADDAAHATLAFPAASSDGRPVEVGAQARELLTEAAEAFEPLAFLRNPEQTMAPKELAEHIGWLTTHEPLR